MRYREAGDVRAEGAALIRLSEYLWCPGRVAESAEAARESVPAPRAARAVPRARTCLRPARVSRASGRRRRERPPPGERAHSNGRSARATCRCSSACSPRSAEAEILQGAEWSEKLDRAAELAEEHGLVEALGWLPHLVARVLIARRSYPEASRMLARAVEFAGEHGLELYRHYDLAYLARAELDQGNWAAAADLAEQVLRARRASTTPTILALTVIGQLRARRGDPDPSSPLDEAQELAALSGELPRLAPVAVARAEAAWLEGQRDAIAAVTDDAYALARRDACLVGRRRARRLAAAGRAARRAGDRPSRSRIRSALRGEHERAAAWWAAHSCPFEAAAGACGFGVGRCAPPVALRVSGARQPRRRPPSSPGACAIAAPAASRAGRVRPRGGTRPG